MFSGRAFCPGTARAGFKIFGPGSGRIQGEASVRLPPLLWKTFLVAALGAVRIVLRSEWTRIVCWRSSGPCGRAGRIAQSQAAGRIGQNGGQDSLFSGRIAGRIFGPESCSIGQDPPGPRNAGELSGGTTLCCVVRQPTPQLAEEVAAYATRRTGRNCTARYQYPIRAGAAEKNRAPRALHFFWALKMSAPQARENF